MAIDWVRRTAWMSIVSQVFLGLLTLVGFARVPSEETPLVWVLLILDVTVQVIEFLFYLIFLLFVRRLETWYRYMDWFISTPIMLVTTMAFLAYLNERTISTAEFATRYQNDIIFVILMNSIMLGFGVCHEARWIPMIVAIPAGSLAFVLTFSAIYARLAYTTAAGICILTFVFVVWSLYGVAACLKYVPKNIMYNLLDIVSKNFYGIVVAIFFLAE